MITGNKGEWSEIYVLLKLLGDKNLYAGDAALNKIESLFYPIIKIIRNESGGNFEYKIEGDIVLISGDREELKIPVSTFTTEAAKLYLKLLEYIVPKKTSMEITGEIDHRIQQVSININRSSSKDESGN